MVRVRLFGDQSLTYQPYKVMAAGTWGIGLRAVAIAVNVLSWGNATVGLGLSHVTN